MSNQESKEYYINNLPPDLPVFHQPFYLNAVTNTKWEVILKIDEGGRILASMPLAYSDPAKKIIRQPPLCIYLGPYFSKQYPALTLSRQMEILEELAQKLTSFNYYNQNWHPSLRNWLPFYWNGFTQSTRYSYQIRVQSTEQAVLGYNENVRRNIKKSARELTVRESTDFPDLISLIGKTFARKHQDNPYDNEILKSVWEVCNKNDCGKIFLAVDVNENIHAAQFLVWDKEVIYYLAGGINEQYKLGAMSFLFDHAIKMAMDAKKKFDFEGSMIQSIEKYFRSFGAEQSDYFVVTKVNSKKLQLLFALAKVYPGFAPF